MRDDQQPVGSSLEMNEQARTLVTHGLEDPQRLVHLCKIAPFAFLLHILCFACHYREIIGSSTGTHVVLGNGGEEDDCAGMAEEASPLAAVACRARDIDDAVCQTLST